MIQRYPVRHLRDAFLYHGIAPLSVTQSDGFSSGDGHTRVSQQGVDCYQQVTHLALLWRALISSRRDGSFLSGIWTVKDVLRLTLQHVIHSCINSACFLWPACVRVNYSLLASILRDFSHAREMLSSSSSLLAFRFVASSHHRNAFIIQSASTVLRP
jgi:hypothetical protein